MQWGATVTGREVQAMLRAEPLTRLLDVRTPGEHDSVHIAGSYNVPLDSLAEHAAEIAKVRHPIVLVCQSGSRAKQAEEVLRHSGLPHLHVLDGGMNSWIANGYAVVRGRPRWSLERQVRLVTGLLVLLGTVLSWLLSPWFAALPLLVGSGLTFAGVTDRCMLGLLLARLPYNQASCDVRGMVQRLQSGMPQANIA